MDAYLCLHLSRLVEEDISSSTYAEEEDGEEEEAKTSSGDRPILHLAMQRKDILESLENLIWQVIARSEARLWLCTEIGSLQNLISRHIQTSSLFVDLIRSSNKNSSICRSDELLCRQALRLACEKQPHKVMQLFRKNSRFIRQFFSGQPKRILGWFENFSSSLKKENLLGAQALAHFAFIHRDKYWKELEWKGSHGQSPAIVASKPYYFLDLDVLKTVENFLDYIPEFWSSDELWDSLRDGDIVSLDINYFIEKLFQRMKDGCSDVWKMLEHFLSEEEFSGLCRHLLSFLSDEQLLGFINNLRFVLSQSRSASQRETTFENNWLIQLLMKGGECPSLDCIMLCNTCITRSRQLLHMLRDEENLEVYDSLKSILIKLKCSKARCAKKLWPLLIEHLNMGIWNMVKILALESISLQILITEECTSVASMKLLFSANLFNFHHGPDDERSMAKMNKREQRKKKKKKKKKRKKRRRNEDLSDSEGLDSSESDLDYDGCSLTDSEKKWYLTHGNFNMVMEKDEIPERLTSYAFQVWLNSAVKQR